MAKKKAPTPAKKRNPQEMTPRNNNARKKEIARLNAKALEFAKKLQKAVKANQPHVDIERSIERVLRRIDVFEASGQPTTTEQIAALEVRVKALEDAKPTVTIEHTFPPES